MMTSSFVEGPVVHLIPQCSLCISFVSTSQSHVLKTYPHSLPDQVIYANPVSMSERFLTDTITRRTKVMSFASLWLPPLFGHLLLSQTLSWALFLQAWGVAYVRLRVLHCPHCQLHLWIKMSKPLVWSFYMFIYANLFQSYIAFSARHMFIFAQINF